MSPIIPKTWSMGKQGCFCFDLSTSSLAPVCSISNDNTARMAEFMRLKVEGILECGEILVVTLCDGRDGHIFGRRTLPEMDLASVACAIQNLWLAARAEGIGMGWVSMFDPVKLGQLLNMPPDAKAVAILCLGHVEAFYQAPMLTLEGWAKPRPLSEFVMENCWVNPE